MSTQKAIPTDAKLYAKVVAIVKARVDRWPSAYASGQVVNEYKKLMQTKNKPAYTNDVNKNNTGLARWYKEKWIDIRTGKECGTHEKNMYPTCRPSKRINNYTPVTANELTQKQKTHMIKEKQKAKEHTVYYKETRNIKN